MKAHKVMTPEEYAAWDIKGWHLVCKNYDGFGGVGMQMITDGVLPLHDHSVECKQEAGAREYQLLSGLHVARGALLGIGTDYAKEVAEHLAGVIDPALIAETDGAKA